MENLTYNMVLAGIGLTIIYQLYKLVQQHQKFKKEIKQMQDDFNIEFKGRGGSVSRQRKNYPEQEHHANDDFRYKIESSEPTSSELNDNVDRRKRHSLNGLT